MGSCKASTFSLWFPVRIQKPRTIFSWVVISLSGLALVVMRSLSQAGPSRGIDLFYVQCREIRGKPFGQLISDLSVMLSRQGMRPTDRGERRVRDEMNVKTHTKPVTAREIFPVNAPGCRCQPSSVKFPISPPRSPSLFPLSAGEVESRRVTPPSALMGRRYFH